MRNFQKLKELSDFHTLDAPVEIPSIYLAGPCPYSAQMVLRVLVRPKYQEKFRIPKTLEWLTGCIKALSDQDRAMTGIHDSWCYVTVRSGPLSSKTDDEWHFDGASFRTDIIPERNYIWVDKYPMEYKVGRLQFPADFDPVRHNLFTYAARCLDGTPHQASKPKTWYMLSPFCLHRRAFVPDGSPRTFVRIAFTDVEGRDINNTQNPLLPTNAFGRDPVRTFRDKLADYPT